MNIKNIKKTSLNLLKKLAKNWNKAKKYLISFSLSQTLIFIALITISTLTLKGLYSKSQISLENRQKENSFKKVLFSSWDLQAKTIEGDLELKISTEKNQSKIAVIKGNKAIEFSTYIEGISHNYDKQNAIFSNKNQKIKLSYQLIDNGIKEEIILSERPVSNQFISSFKIKNLNAFYKDDFIIFEDYDGNYQFNIDRPYAYDAAGNITHAVKYELKEINAEEIINEAFDDEIFNQVEFLTGKKAIDQEENKQYQLITTVDKNWLNSESRVYPITIDPTIVHDTSAEFSTGVFNRNEDTGSGSAPVLETSYQELPTDEHTVGLWHMDEGAANTCAGGVNDICDASGNSNDGAFGGNTAHSATSKIGNYSIDFDGTDDYVNLGDIDAIDNVEQFSVELWFNRNSDKNSASGHGTENVLISKASNADNDIFEIGTDGTEVDIYIDSIGTNNYFTSFEADIQDNVWLHLAVTYDGNKTQIYLDGELITSSSLWSGNLDLDSTAPVALGLVRPSGDLTGDFDGQLDEVRLSNIARTPEEVKTSASRRPYSVYTSPVIDLTSVSSWNSFSWEELGVTTGDGETVYDSTSLVAQWNLNETSGTTANNDAEGSSCGGTPADCDGTLSGFDSTASQDADPDSSWTADNRRWGAGALQFDGTDSYASITDNNSLDLTSDVSISAWINIDDTSLNLQTILGKRDVSAIEANYVIRTGTGDNSDEIQFYFASSGAWQIFTTTDASLLTRQWYHIVATYDGSSVKIYKNGQALNGSCTAGTCDMSMVADTNALTIGRPGDKTADYFKGIIDSVQIYSRILPENEIISLYNSSNVQLQTRVGASSTPNDGSWDSWSPTTNSTQLDTFDSEAGWNLDLSTTVNISSASSTLKKEGTASHRINLGTPIIDANTVAYWNLDETNGDNASDDVFDATANNNDGEFNGTDLASGIVDGIRGKAREFNGSDDYIEADVQLVSAYPFTLSTWFKTTDSSAANRMILTIADKDAANIMYGIGISDTHEVRMSAINTTEYEAVGSQILNDGKWHHIAGVFNSSTDRKIYVDGEYEASNTTSVAYNTAIDRWSIGRWGDSSPTAYFPGSVDEARVDDVALTAEEIAQSYRMGRDHYLNKYLSTDLSDDNQIAFDVAADKPGTYISATIGESAYTNYQADSNTLGLWHLDEVGDNSCSGGEDVCDASGNDNHGTDTGGSTAGNTGEIGSSRRFDGTDDQIGLNSSIDLAEDSAWTVSYWFYHDLDSGNDMTLGQNAVNYNRLFHRDTGAIYKMRFHLNDGTSIDFDPGYELRGSWHKFDLVCDGSDSSNLIAYLDGKHFDTETSANSRLIIDSIGNPYTTNAYVWDGELDEIRIDDLARTPVEIRQAYEIGRRTHPITIDFAASLDSGNLIADSADTSFTIDATPYGLSEMGSMLFEGDKIILKENISGIEYLAQATVTAITSSTGATTVASWDSGATFPSSGYTANANVFKWQREYFDLSGVSLGEQINAINKLSLKITNGYEGRTIWIDDLTSEGDFLTTPAGSTLGSSTGNQYFQYRTIFSSSDRDVSATIDTVTLDYVANSAPSTPSLDLPADTATNQSLSPVLKTTTTDAQSDYLRYKIELCEDLGMTSNCQTFDQTSSQTGWSGQDTETSTAYASGTQAVYTIQTPLAANTTYYWRSYAIDPAGTNTWSSTQGTPYSFTTSSAPTAPTTPYAEGSANPSGIIDLTPEFSAIHNDPSGDSANYYQIQVNTASDFSGSSMWDSDKSSMTTTTNTSRSPDINYAGSSLSLDGTSYYWKIKFWDTLGAEGAWSATQNFTMNSAPSTPSLDLPTDTATDQSLSPILKTTGTDTDSDYLRYKIELCENLAMTTSCQTFDQTSSQTGWSGQDTETSTAYASGTQAVYTIQTPLNTDTTYYWRSYAIDPAGTNTWSSTQGTPYSFATHNTPNQPDTCSLSRNPLNNNITVNWTDSNALKDSYTLQKKTNTGAFTNLATSIPITTFEQLDTAISTGNTYQYRVATIYSSISSDWCTTAPLSIGLGGFFFESLNLSGFDIN